MAGGVVWRGAEGRRTEDPLGTGHRAVDRLLVLDYDGTLVPRVPRPRDARLRVSLRRELDRWATTPGTRVLVMTGRSQTGLRRVLGPRGPLLWITHGGWALSGDSGRWIHPEALRNRDRVERWARALRERWPPSVVRVEHKRWTLAVHIPSTAVRHAWIDREGDRLREEFRVIPAHGGWELAPRGGWGKAAVARWLVDRWRPSRYMAAGDDAIDREWIAEAGQGGARAYWVGDVQPPAGARVVADPAALWQELRDGMAGGS